MKVFIIAKWAMLFTCFISISGQSQWIKKTFPYNEDLYIVRFITPEIGWIAGNHHLFKSTDNGATWNIKDTIATWKGLHVIDEMTVIFHDYRRGIRRTTDGGNTWITVDSTVRWINSFNFVNSILGFAAGGSFDTADVYRTVDGGNNWERIAHQYIDNNNKPSSDFSKVSFIDSLHGWGVTYGGMIFHSSDGGYNWTFQDSTASENFAPLRDIQFTTPDSGLAVGGISGNSIILRTTDGGTNWISSSIPVSFTACSFREIFMIDSKVGWLVGSYNGGPSYIIKTTDGGDTWIDQTPDPENEYIGFESISMLDEFHGYMVGFEGKFYETTNGGVTGIAENITSTAHQFFLNQNYPNPFNPSTTIKYSIPKKSFISLKVYDILGKEITSLINEVKSPGNYTVEYNAGNLPSGIYFYKIAADGYTAAKKMVIIK